MKTPTPEEQSMSEEEPEAEAAEEEKTLEELVEEEEAPAAAPAPAEAEKEAAKPKKKKEEEEEVVEEKTYTIPLGKALIMPPRKRAPRAMRMIKAFVTKHMKIPTRAEEEDEEPPALTITREVNERIWGQGIEKPPRKIRVRATKDKDGNVTVHLAEEQKS
ncbi:MAG: 50S ribosomal protein L31e [Candidatus Bathyarchaeia archaeon]